MAEPWGAEYLKNKLNIKKNRVDTRYRYYEMKNAVQDFRITTPAKLAYLSETLGWCGKAVDSLADRLQFRGFQSENDVFDLNEIYNMNNPDVLFDSAIISALIGSCSFIYLSPDQDGYPRLQVLDGREGTGVMDPITGLLTEGYAILERDKEGNPTMEAYFLPGQTQYFANGKPMSVQHFSAEYAMLVPIVYRPDAARPFGHSRISRACMNIMQAALRTMKRMEIASEFYSFPQRYVLGLSDDTEEFDSWKLTISTMVSFGKDDDGEKPAVGQFPAQSMSPYTEQLRTLASLFAGETGLTLDDLGFVADNPSSEEAIKAAHENLRICARKAQRTFGRGFLNAGYMAACMRDKTAYSRGSFYLTKPVWYPVFEPDASAMAMIGDAAAKINSAVPDFIGKNNLELFTGIEAD